MSFLCSLEASGGGGYMSHTFTHRHTQTHTNVVPLLVESIRAGLKEEGDRYRLQEEEEEEEMSNRRRKHACHMRRRMHAFKKGSCQRSSDNEKK
jgi:hypothetical protein